MLGSSVHAVGSLVRRGLEGPVDAQLLEQQTMAYENSPFNVSNWSVYALLATVVFCAFVITAVRYTNWEIISTIAMIETPTTTVLVKTEKPLSEKPDALAEDLVEAEMITIKQKPITSSIMGATRYLRSKGGVFFRFRGLSFFIIYQAVHFLVHTTFMNIIGNVIGDLNFVARETRFTNTGAMVVDQFIYAATSGILAPLAMAFTHVIISLPANLRMSERVPQYSDIRGSSLIGAAIAHAMVKRFTFTIPVVLFMGMGLNDIKEVNEENIRFVALSALSIFIIFILYAHLLLRTTVVLVRVQASLLPENVEPIVAFDRTFGGKVVSKADGGSGHLALMHARPDVTTDLRLIKLFVKMVLIDLKLHILSGLMIFGVAYLTMGPAMKPFLVSSHAQLTNRTLPV